MQSLPELFVEMLRGQGYSSASFHIDREPSFSLAFPAVCEGIGDLVITVHGSTIDVAIGKLYHAHFASPEEPHTSKLERRQYVVESAGKFVDDVLNNRVRFRVEYARGKCVSFTSWYPGTSEPGPPAARVDHVIEFQWSGMIST